MFRHKYVRYHLDNMLFFYPALMDYSAKATCPSLKRIISNLAEPSTNCKDLILIGFTASEQTALGLRFWSVEPSGKIWKRNCQISGFGMWLSAESFGEREDGGTKLGASLGETVAGRGAEAERWRPPETSPAAVRSTGGTSVQFRFRTRFCMKWSWCQFLLVFNRF